MIYIQSIQRIPFNSILDIQVVPVELVHKNPLNYTKLDNIFPTARLLSGVKIAVVMGGNNDSWAQYNYDYGQS